MSLFKASERIRLANRRARAAEELREKEVADMRSEIVELRDTLTTAVNRLEALVTYCEALRDLVKLNDEILGHHTTQIDAMIKRERPV